jgi:predicted CoA-binding protein
VRLCTFRHQKPHDDIACSILRQFDHIAVVGLSDNPWRDSNYVAAYLLRQGYSITPINPHIAEVFGLSSYPNLLSAPRPVEVVEVFRREEFIPEIIEEAIKVGAKAVWIEGGMGDKASLSRAKQAGLRVVTHRCMMIDHDLHLGGQGPASHIR